MRSSCLTVERTPACVATPGCRLSIRRSFRIWKSESPITANPPGVRAQSRSAPEEFPGRRLDWGTRQRPGNWKRLRTYLKSYRRNREVMFALKEKIIRSTQERNRGKEKAHGPQ